MNVQHNHQGNHDHLDNNDHHLSTHPSSSRKHIDHSRGEPGLDGQLGKLQGSQGGNLDDGHQGHGGDLDMRTPMKIAINIKQHCHHD